MSIHTVINDLPVTLTRVFDRREYAESFAERGSARLGEIKGYREIEGQRQDSAEAESYALVPGDVPVVTLDTSDGRIISESTQPAHFHRRSSFLNPTYLMCCSGPGADLNAMGERFGRWAVRINDPAEMIARLAAHAAASMPTGREALYIEAFPVLYNKGAVLSLAEVELLKQRIDYGQKPAEYACESEYRVVVVVSGLQRDAPTHLDVSMGCLTDIATILELPAAAAAPAS